MQLLVQYVDDFNGQTAQVQLFFPVRNTASYAT